VERVETSRSDRGSGAIRVQASQFMGKPVTAIAQRADRLALLGGLMVR